MFLCNMRMREVKKKKKTKKDCQFLKSKKISSHCKQYCLAVFIQAHHAYLRSGKVG